MSVRVSDRVEDWNQRAFEGGYAAVQDLADESFSGVVRSGGAELYMTAGTAVGIAHGVVADFEGGSGSAFEAPEPALPLLAVMQAADAEVRAQYYTEETPIAEVDRTLSDGGFTGFLELSENVLSGDYFQIYHGGRSMAVGFVGASERLISGDEAFETADDEVGIYKVYQVDVDPIEIPDPVESDTTDTAAESAESAAPAGVSEAQTAEDEIAEAESDSVTPSKTETLDGESVEAEPDTGRDETPAEPEPDSSAPAAAEKPSASTGEAGSAGDPGDPETGAEARSTPSASTGEAGSAGDPGDPETGAEARSTPSASSGGGSAAGQARDLETRSVPSLDPDLTNAPSSGTGQSRSRDRPTPRPEPSPESGGSPEPRQEAAGSGRDSPAKTGTTEPAASEEGGGSPELAELESDLADREAEIERLEADLEEAEADREELRTELEAAIEERDDLAAEVDRLEAELERLESEFGAATEAEQRMTPAEAIEGTNLFVDYDSKGAATLEDAHAGAQSRQEVGENLQLGVHTEFDDRTVAVGGQAYDEFLRSTLHFRFAEWVVSTLLFEIRDTGHTETLSDLYETIPAIRRVEFNGAIDVEYVEDGQEKGGRERFHVIFRHRMGEPLLVANLNNTRDPATGGMMETLVTSAERVGQTADSLSGALLVTSSFFESEALETVSEATQGGLLSRDKRKSFVNLSRKQGYHLCLVAAREGNFHMEVPEL